VLSAIANLRCRGGEEDTESYPSGYPTAWLADAGPIGTGRRAATLHKRALAEGLALRRLG